MARHAWIAIRLAAGATLCGLLAATVTLAYVPMGAGNTVASLGIAAAKAALIMLVYMKLWHGRPLDRLAAGTSIP